VNGYLGSELAFFQDPIFPAGKISSPVKFVNIKPMLFYNFVSKAELTRVV